VRHAGGAPSGQACSVKVALCGARFFLDGDGAHDFEDTPPTTNSKVSTLWSAR
jgi:hypothetical protein